MDNESIAISVKYNELKDEIHIIAPLSNITFINERVTYNLYYKTESEEKNNCFCH